MRRLTATLGGGCFWCLEAIFGDLAGVIKVVPGYSGGHLPNPSYQQVCKNETGHAEVIQIHYDDDVITYAELLQVFFHTHDPTTLNRQGADVGTQYRSVIFYHNQKQKAIAEKAIIEAAVLWKQSVVTELSPLDEFFPAEPYHHNYFNLNPDQNYCRLVINPKVVKFRTQFASKLRNSSVDR